MLELHCPTNSSSEQTAHIDSELKMSGCYSETIFTVSAAQSILLQSKGGR